MKTAQEELKEKGIEPRRIIFDVINCIATDYPRNMTDEDKVSKLVFWHVGLADIPDEGVMSGLKSLLDNPSEFPPNCGKFKEFCKTRQQSNLIEGPGEEPYNPIIDEKERSKNFSKIIDKLELPKVLKEKEFMLFKRNRAQIEKTRKLKLLK